VLIEQSLEYSADQFLHKVALVTHKERLTYRQIEEQANRTAHALISKGVQRRPRYPQT